MKALNQNWKGVAGLSGMASATSLVLGMCLLLGPGFQVSNLILQSYSDTVGSYIENSYQPDWTITRLERHVAASERAQRRQSSFGVPPTAVELATFDISSGRTVADVRCDRLIAASHQNDRAPPC